jgi:hypothetical protein
MRSIVECVRITGNARVVEAAQLALDRLPELNTSRQSQDFVIVFFCSRLRISSFLEKMLIEPDSNATRENDLHMLYGHSSIHP